MKTLVAAGRIEPKAHHPRRCDSVTIVVNLRGEDARRFETYRGQRCPREVAHELMFERLDQVEEHDREILEEMFREN